MAYADQNLMAGEHVVYRARLHWKGFVWGAGAIAIGLAYSILLGRVRSWLGAEFLESGWLMLPAYLCFFIGGLLAAVHWLDRLCSEYVVTNRRVLVKRGLIRRSSMELLLEKIENISVDQSIVDRIIGAATIIFIGTGGTPHPFHEIGRPFELRRKVQEAIASRQAPAPVRTD